MGCAPGRRPAQPQRGRHQREAGAAAHRAAGVGLDGVGPLHDHPQAALLGRGLRPRDRARPLGRGRVEPERLRERHDGGVGADDDPHRVPARKRVEPDRDGVGPEVAQQADQHRVVVVRPRLHRGFPGEVRVANATIVAMASMSCVARGRSMSPTISRIVRMAARVTRSRRSKRSPSSASIAVPRRDQGRRAGPFL